MTIWILIVSIALCDKHPLLLPSMVAHWPTSDEAALIDFLVEHKAEASDGFSFKGATWPANIDFAYGIDMAKKIFIITQSCHGIQSEQRILI